MKAIITLIATALAFSLTGCAPAVESAPPKDEVSAETTTAPPAETEVPIETPEPTIEPAPESPESERGYLIKEIGQEASLTGYDQEELVVFTVDAIERDPTCTSGYPETPINGHYLAVTITAQTFPALANNEIGTVSFTEWAWEAYSSSGVRLNDPVGTGYSCLSNGEMMPSEIGAGQKVTGTIVLDVADLHGTVAYMPYTGIGWEWSY